MNPIDLLDLSLCSKTTRNLVKQCDFEVETVAISASKTTLFFGKELKQMTWEFAKDVERDDGARTVDGVHFEKATKHEDRLELLSQSESYETETLLVLKYFDELLQIKDYTTEMDCDLRFVVDVLLPLAPRQCPSFRFPETTVLSAEDFKKLMDHYEGVQEIDVNLQALVFHEKMLQMEAIRIGVPADVDLNELMKIDCDYLELDGNSQKTNHFGD
ncbi:unnamed protein product [Caenorhabditis sp. 36 PRJEB53466]|nr:unnamed protein product [Caenorhabditis sp. 36 PRJEB53466]